MEEKKSIYDYSKEFALEIINLYKFLTQKSTVKEYVMSKQILRSGTSIGANIHEAKRAQSKADFAAKMNIALKEASETEYWLDLLYKSEYIDESYFMSLNSSCISINNILSAIVKTTFDNIEKEKLKNN